MYFSVPSHPLIKGTAYTCINLSWLPNGANSVVLQEYVWQDAHDIWTQTVLKDRRGTNKDTRLVDDSSLLNALQDLGPTIFRTTEGRTSIGVVPLLSWLTNCVRSLLPCVRAHLTFTFFRPYLNLEITLSRPSPSVTLTSISFSSLYVHSVGATSYTTRGAKIHTPTFKMST